MPPCSGHHRRCAPAAGSRSGPSSGQPAAAARLLRTAVACRLSRGRALASREARGTLRGSWGAAPWAGHRAAQSPAPSGAVPLTRRRPHPQSLEKYVLSFRSRSMNRCSSPRRQTWPSAELPAAHCPARPAEPLVSAAGRWAPPAGSAARANCAGRRPRKPRGAPVPRPPLQPAPLARRRDEPSGSRRRRAGAGHCCQADAARCPAVPGGRARAAAPPPEPRALCLGGFVATSFLHQLGKTEQLPPRRAETSSRRRGSARSREASRALDAPREARGRAGGRRVRAVPGRRARLPAGLWAPPAGAASAPGPRAATQAKDALSRRPQADHQTPPSASTALAVTEPPAGRGQTGQTDGDRSPARGRSSRDGQKRPRPGGGRHPAIEGAGSGVARRRGAGARVAEGERPTGTGCSLRSPAM